MNLMTIGYAVLTETPKEPFNWVMGLVIAVVFALFIALIYVSALKGKLHSVIANDQASDYKRDGSFKVELSKEIFLYSKLEKKEKPQQQNTNTK